MDLFLVELAVADWPTPVAWYPARLGTGVDRLDAPHKYALLIAGAGRVALKAGPPSLGTTKLIFRVAGLDAELTRLKRAGVVPTGPVKTSAEGYRSARIADVD